MEFKEFLDTMSGQIRSQKARAVAVREMEDHIRDVQKGENPLRCISVLKGKFCQEPRSGKEL